MTRAQMLAFQRTLEGPVRDAFANIIRTAQGRANISRVVAAIQAGGTAGDVYIAAGLRETMWSSLTEAVRTAYKDSGSFVLGINGAQKFGLQFDINNPRAQTWLARESAALIRGDAAGGGLVAEQRAAIQAMLESGFARGANPRTIALDIVGRVSPTGRRAGGVLGLTGPQAGHVERMEAILRTNPREYFIKDRITGEYKPRFTLSDRRFDGTVKQAIENGKPIPKATREKMVTRYQDRLLKHRGDTIGRTEALRALNEASDEALRQVVDEGLAPRQAVKKIWRHSYSANEREGHALMTGTERGLDEYFTNPVTGYQLLYPHDSTAPASETINCRCYIEHDIDFIAVEQAA